MTSTMKTPMEYIIVAVSFHADAATRDGRARKGNERLVCGYDWLGTPNLSGEMMYQSMTKLMDTSSKSPSS